MSQDRLDAVPSLAAQFGSADWSFLSKGPRPGTEFHPYPARFIPQVPAQVLDLLQVQSGTVLDPFCGSGTTLAEARRNGLDALGVDINPIACLISRVRTSRWTPGDSAALMRHQAALLVAAEESDDVGDEFADIPRLDHWFAEHAQRALTGAVRYVQSLDPADPWRDRVAVSVSAATVRVSRQESDTRYAAVEKAGDQQTAADGLARALGRTGQWLRANSGDYAAESKAMVLQRDARDLSPIPDGSVSAVCFSPPYPNAYEYWLYHKYRMYWLGFDAVQVREQEIGARPYYSKPNGLDEFDFAAQMSQVFEELARVMRDGAVAVVVVGDSVIGGRSIDNGALLTGVAENAGFSTEFAGQRPIATGRSSFNRAHSRGRTSEHILAFRRLS